MIQIDKSSGDPTNAQLIMLVEDDVGIREPLEDFLGFEGYRTLSAENGQVALGLIQSGSCPSLILLDLFMPVMSGEGFLTYVLKQSLVAHVPIIVLSAAPSPETALSEVKHRVAAFLRKPTSLQALHAAILEHTVNEQYPDRKRAP